MNINENPTPHMKVRTDAPRPDSRPWLFRDVPVPRLAAYCYRAALFVYLVKSFGWWPS